MACTLPPVLPSPPEVLALAAKVPAAFPPPPSLSTHLTPVLSLLRNTWIRDFLFTPDPIHIPHLSSPNLSNSAFTTSASTTRIEKPTPLPIHTEPESHHLRTRHLYVPAFSADAITAGFGVMHIDSHMACPGPHPTWIPGCSETILFRFVRDTASNSVCEVYDCPEKQSVMLFHTTLLSTTQSRSTTILFSRPLLKRALKNSNTIPDAKALTAATMCFWTEIQSHNCRVCQAPPALCPECPITHPKPRHPFDNSAFYLSMRAELGTYTSLASKICFFNSAVHRYNVLASRTVNDSMIDPWFVRDASAWAISKDLRRQVQDPRQSILRISNDDEDNGLIEDGVSFNDGRVVDVLGELLAQVGGQARLTELEVPNDVGLGAGRECSTYLEDGTISGGATSEFVETDGQVSGIQNSVVGENAQHMSRREQDWWETRCTPHEDFAPTDGSNGTPSIADGANVNVENDEASEESETKARDEERRKEEILAERRLRAQLRRERNREAARKSNKKRKQKRDTLVSELERSRGKIGMLREKEVLLRQENLRLRKMAANNG